MTYQESTVTNQPPECLNRKYLHIRGLFISPREERSLIMLTGVVKLLTRSPYLLRCSLRQEPLPLCTGDVEVGSTHSCITADTHTSPGKSGILTETALLLVTKITQHFLIFQKCQCATVSLLTTFHFDIYSGLSTEILTLPCEFLIKLLSGFTW